MDASYGSRVGEKAVSETPEGAAIEWGCARLAKVPASPVTCGAHTRVVIPGRE